MELKILITYSSKTGNTKRLAEGVYEGLKDKYDMTIVDMATKPSVEDFDLIMPAYWVDKGTANKISQKFIQKIENKKVLFLATLGADPEGEHGQKVRNRAPELLKPSNEYLGLFLARGKVDPKLTARIKFLPMPKKLKDQMYESSINSRETNETDIANGIEFVDGVLKSL